MELEHVLWVEKYRPQNINDCILPIKLKSLFKKIAVEKVALNLLLSGPPGTGKTTVAKALMNEIDADYMLINASKEGNIDTLRTNIEDYANRVSLTGRRKYVILDEADGLTRVTQQALRTFIEDNAVNCGFIMSCNWKGNIIEPLQSRFALIEFKAPSDPTERKGLVKEVFAAFTTILKKEKVEFTAGALLNHILRFYPDIRKALNELQAYSKVNGKIDEGILASFDRNLTELFAILKAKKFNEARKWIAQNDDIPTVDLFASIYKMADEMIKAESLPLLVALLADYQYKSAIVANQEINTMALFTEAMRNLEFR